MEGQAKWGVSFIIIGMILVLAVDVLIIRLIYGGALILLGLALIHFRGREAVIEQVEVNE